MTEDDHPRPGREARAAGDEEPRPVEVAQRLRETGLVGDQQRRVLVEQCGSVAQPAATGPDAFGRDHAGLEAVQPCLRPGKGQPDQRVEQVVPAAGLAGAGGHLTGRPDVGFVRRVTGDVGRGEAQRPAAAVDQSVLARAVVQMPDAARPAAGREVVRDRIEERAVGREPGRGPVRLNRRSAGTGPGAGSADRRRRRDVRCRGDTAGFRALVPARVHARATSRQFSVSPPASGTIASPGNGSASGIVQDSRRSVTRPALTGNR